MRAAVLETAGQPLVLREDIQIEKPRAGQVRVRVVACGICHSDLSVVNGTFPARVPVILGHEAAGVVDAVGPHVDSVKVGDAVVLTACPPCGSCFWCVRNQSSLCVNSQGIQTQTLRDGTTGLSRDGAIVYRGVGLGGFAELVLVPATGAVRVPSEVPLDVACVIGCAVQTGVGAVLNTAAVEAGATVLVTGLGGVGLSVVQGARLASASRILVSDPVPERRAAAARFGATDLLDPDSDEVVSRVHALVPPGVDYAFETAGRACLIENCIQATRAGGTTICIGAPPLTDALSLPVPAAFIMAEKKILGSLLGSCNSLAEIPRLVALWQSGHLDLEGLVTARRPLEQINEGMEDLAQGRGIRTVLTL